jgi:uncharacterized protein
MNTALITGASSGIGWELAHLFAADGCGLVLVARREDRLQRLATELQQAYQAPVEIIAADLSRSDGVGVVCDRLEQSVLQVDVLVNNAGFGMVGRFADLDADSQQAMIAVNIQSLTLLTRRLLPRMIESKCGGVLNVASVAAYQPGPYMAVYYASKSYVLSFSHALREELVSSGVTVTCLAPGPTVSEFGETSGLDRYKFFTTGALTSAAVAKIGYRGFCKGQAVVIPGFRNRFMAALVQRLPHGWTRKVIARLQVPHGI